MKSIITLFIIFTSFLYCKSQDTLLLEDKGYMIGQLTKSNKKKGIWLVYDSTNTLKYEKIYKSYKKNPQRTTLFHYNKKHKLTYTSTIIYRFKHIYRSEKHYYDNNQLTSKGYIKPYSGKYGKWKYYENNKLIEIKRFKYNKLHGKSKNLKSNTTTKYKYGILKDHLKNKNGKKYVFFFSFGMPKYWGDKTSCKREKKEQFAYKRIQIAGCLVTNKILFKSKIHNFFANLKQCYRFGFKWREKFNEGC